MAEVGLAVVLVLVVRPLAGWLGLLRGRTGPRERSVISFFGVRGIGSLYYLAYGLSQADVSGAQQLWRMTVLVVLVSVVVHGIAATPAMAWLDVRRRSAAVTSRGRAAAASVTPVRAGVGGPTPTVCR